MRPFDRLPARTPPEFVPPMMAESAKSPFDSPDWIFEIKLDGYRAITVFDAARKPHLWSRNGLPLEQKFPAIANSALRWPRGKITVNLAPATVRKEGPSFDLPNRHLGQCAQDAQGRCAVERWRSPSAPRKACASPGSTASSGRDATKPFQNIESA
jgi:hypothetical protein